MPFVIIHSRKQGAHASRPCVTSTALVRRFASDGHEIALTYVQFLSSRIRRSPTGAIGITYALTLIEGAKN